MEETKQLTTSVSSNPHHRDNRVNRPDRGPNKRFQNRRRPRGPPPEPKTPPKQCSVCELIDPPKQYKCPKCRALYCSVACCREHKLKCPGAPVVDKPVVVSQYVCDLPPETADKPRWKRPKLNSRDEDDEEDGWKITEDMKNRMMSSSWLRDHLSDRGLRHLLTQVYEASNLVPKQRKNFRNRGAQYDDDVIQTDQERRLRQLKEDFPKFAEFTDKLLVLTGVLQQDGSNEVDLNGPINRQGLTLQPALRSATCARPTKLLDELVSDKDEVDSE